MNNEKLDSAREEINNIDARLTELISQRMEVVAHIAKIKKECGIPVYDPEREKKVLDNVSASAGPDKAKYLRQIYQYMMDTGKNYERDLIYSEKSESTPQLEDLPQRPKVACQGVLGAFSGEAAQYMFPGCELYFVPSWEDTFTEVENARCDLAVLPVENSLAGSVGQVYDLLLHYRFAINYACRLPVEQNLLALPQATLDDIHEIYSHPQAIAQCKKYCSTLPLARTIPMENTAAAAKMVSSLGDIQKAAIASRHCAEIYGLKVLAPDIQTAKQNTTRFVAVSRKSFKSKTANKISLVFSLPHRPGALNQLLSQFAALDLNLTKIESRPVAGKNFEYYFYLDFSGNTSSRDIQLLMEDLSRSLPAFTFLGNYPEI